MYLLSCEISLFYYFIKLHKYINFKTQCYLELGIGRNNFIFLSVLKTHKKILQILRKITKKSPKKQSTHYNSNF